MRYTSLIVDDFPTNGSSRVLQRCIFLAFVAGVVFYCIYSVVKVPDSEVATVGRLQSPCECDPPAEPEAAFDRGRLFYNRVPKCGSTTLYTLIRKLSTMNGFVHHNSKVYDKRFVDEEEQRRLVKLIKSKPAPCSFDRHVFFINFTRFGETPPVYINIIRDPVERIISSFFYRRMMARMNKTKIRPSAYWLNKKFEHCVLTPDPECTFLEGQNYSVLQLPYFCGQELQCQMLNDPGALTQAKRNIERFYSVVGTLEQMNVTLQVLESTLPQFFGGAFEVYHSFGVHLNQNLHKEQVSEEVKALLRANLTAEYELYHFVQQRLYQQFRQLVKDRKIAEQSSSIDDTFAA